MTEIAHRIRSFLLRSTPETAGDTQIKNIQSNSGNDNFLHLMRFLDKIKSILSLNKNTDQSRNKEINRVLDQITLKLNEQIKANIKRNTDLINNDKVGMLNKKGVAFPQNSTVRSDEANVKKRSDLNLIRTPINNTNAKASGNAEITQLTQRAEKVKSKIKPDPLGKVFDGEKNSDAASNGINKAIKTKSDLMPQQGPSNGAFGKDLSIESNLAKESIVSGSKLDTHITASQGNSTRAPIANNQNSNALLNSLNMLSKSWGEKLIEKIEKSIVDGIEKIE